MMNQDNPYAMNQTCKVCGEPAAGFHFGAFTCEGCKSFFGRSYNNLSSISDCKNNGECIINKKNRTACKACRLRKCLMVGMSKSGSRYGRRSNWFKIHCLLQEQQQQAAAAMAAHHNNQQQHQQQQAAAQAAQQQQHGVPGQKPPSHPSAGGGPLGGMPPSSAAAAALGMFGNAGAYPGLYPPRTKEELMMLGLEEYAKHPAASPSVSSPDSHNSDSSIEVNVRGNPMLHLTGKHVNAESTATAAATASAAQHHHHLRKDLPHFLPLPFPGLSSMPVMPPPAFLPPSHLIFPGYHPALYQHHQSLLKPSAEQQQAAVAAAAVQHLFNSSAASNNRFAPTLSTASHPLVKLHEKQDDTHMQTQSPKADTLNNNHIPNGSKAAQELTKRFYLDAVLKSQRNASPPPPATKLPAHIKHDHSISALVTPNSESGSERLKSRHSNDDDNDAALDDKHGSDEIIDAHSNGNDSESSGEDLVVSMTPPRSPAAITNTQRPTAAITTEPAQPATIAQDNPIDLSMKTGSSTASSLSSKCSTAGSVQATDSDNENETETELEVQVQVKSQQDENEIELQVDGDDGDVDEDNSTTETVKTSVYSNNILTNNNNNNNNCNASSKLNDSSGDDSEESNMKLDGIKRKLCALAKSETTEASLEAELTNMTKRSKLQNDNVMEKIKVNAAALDLTTKV